jgi:hypothetical protein
LYLAADCWLIKFHHVVVKFLQVQKHPKGFLVKEGTVVLSMWQRVHFENLTEGVQTIYKTNTLPH